jgi:hypothetical protein
MCEQCAKNLAAGKWAPLVCPKCLPPYGRTKMGPATRDAIEKELK